MDCFLVLRGLKTLHLRMERHAANAAKVADFLTRHPKVLKVTWPGLAEHPQPGWLAARCRAGGMMTFEIEAGWKRRRFLKAVACSPARSRWRVSRSSASGHVTRDSQDTRELSASPTDS
jgi:cystathionine beta-lyase/cystathionine gamma-synthase